MKASSAANHGGFVLQLGAHLLDPALGCRANRSDFERPATSAPNRETSGGD
jgi:hypothetical protein